VLARVTNLTGVSARSWSPTATSSPDGFDDQLNAGLVSLSTPIPSGNFVKISFDCRASAPVPTLGDFGCVSDVSTQLGDTVSSSCQVTNLVTTP